MMSLARRLLVPESLVSRVVEEAEDVVEDAVSFLFKLLA
jgi:hypothetical protein